MRIMTIVESFAHTYHATYKVKRRFSEKRKYFKTRLDKRNTHLLIYHFVYHIIYHFVYLYFSTIVRQVLLYIIKEVDRSEDLQSQQLVNLNGSILDQ